MHYTDKAIENIRDDKLGRSSFSKRIAEFINNYKDIESFSLGLTGKWGTGKTSIINMIRENISSDILVYNFNPWDISVREQLFGDFFSGMSLILDSKEGNNIENAKEISQKLKLYANIFKPLKYIPMIAPIVEAVSEILNITSDNLKSYSESREKDLFSLKKELNESLKKINKKILIIIDDVDRLSDEEIKEIFHLIKSVGDLSNTIYLLSYDKDLVKNVMDKIQKNRGEEYTEKLINMEITVPQTKKVDVDLIFKKEILYIFPELSNEKKYHSDTVNDLFKHILKDKFYNLREVKRFMNTLSFSSYFAKKLNIIDFIIIQFLRENEPTIYDGIKSSDFKIDKSNDLLNFLYKRRDYKFIGREFTNSDYKYQYFSLDIEELPEVLRCSNVSQLESLILSDVLKGKEYIRKILSSSVEISSKDLIRYFEVVLKTLYITDNSDFIIKQGDIYSQINIFVEGIDNKDDLKRVLNSIELNEKYNYREFFKFLNNLQLNHSLDIEEIMKKHIKGILSKKEINHNLVNSFYELNRFKNDLVKKFLNDCFKDENKIFDFIRCSQDEINHQLDTYPIVENGEIVGESEPEISFDCVVFYEDIARYFNYDKLVTLVNLIKRDLTDDEKKLKELLLQKLSREEYEEQNLLNNP